MKSKLIIFVIAAGLVTACGPSKEDLAALHAGYVKMNPEAAILTDEEFAAMFEAKMLSGQACTEIANSARNAENSAAAAAAMSGVAAGLAASRR